MKKVMIIGCCGAGKSTLAEKLYQRIGIPIIHLDKLYWLPNWTEPKVEDWEAIVEKITEGEHWIMDGNYGGTMDIRLLKADTIIYLERSRWLCLYRVFKRIIKNYGKTRKDMAAGCVERFDWDFLVYTYKFNTIQKPKIIQRLTKVQSEKNIIILKNDKEIFNFLNHTKTQFSK